MALGDLAVLFAALSIAVAALTGVGFLVDRVDRAMKLTATEVLGADLRLSSPRTIGPDYAAEAARRGLATADLTSLLSVVLLGDASQLSNVHAVTPGYPLRGRVRVSQNAFDTPSFATDIPAPGEVWPDSRLAAALGATVGSQLEVGSQRLRVSRIMISRPDQGSNFVDLAPSLLLNATGSGSDEADPGGQPRQLRPALLRLDAGRGRLQGVAREGAPARRAAARRLRCEPRHRECQRSRRPLPVAREPRRA